MSDRREQDTEYEQRWLESRLQKMERDVVKGSALQRILQAEKDDDRNSTRVGTEQERQAESEGQQQLVLPGE